MEELEMSGSSELKMLDKLRRYKTLARSPCPLSGVFLRTGRIRFGVFFVDVAELVYALGLGSSGAIHGGSSPLIDISILI